MASDPQAGEQITPSLSLVRKLGAGGMGTVWIAHHQGLRTDVVVKFITGDLARNPEVVTRFQREAAAASEVRSPHVVQVFDHGLTHTGLPYIAMERLEGEDLAARLLRDRVMPPGEVAGVVVQVARALSRAHEKKIVHRDIKPENIFLCETGEDEAFVKVLDFGIAKVNVVEQLGGTATGAMLGSPYWMSPEQVVGSKSLDYRTDLWSLAVVAFYALTGTRAFDAETIGGLSVAICGGDIPLPSQRNPRLVGSIDQWFIRACARDANARFQSARAMADALVAAVGGAAVAKVRSKSAPPTEDAETQQMSGPELVEFARMQAQRSPPPVASMQSHGSAPRTFASTTGPASIDPRLPTGTTTAAGSRGSSRLVWWIGGAAALLSIGVAGILVTRTSASDAVESAEPAATHGKAKPARVDVDEPAAPPAVNSSAAPAAPAATEPPAAAPPSTPEAAVAPKPEKKAGAPKPPIGAPSPAVTASAAVIAPTVAAPKPPPPEATVKKGVVKDEPLF